MQARKFQTLTYYLFENFSEKIVTHGVFTRQGGVSPKPWDSLNLGGTVGDDRANVIENRRRVFAALDRPVESIYDAWQVHGTEVICVDRPRALNEPHVQGDAIVTAKPEVTLLMRFADCVPILLYDPTRRIIGIAHAGWKGSIEGISSITVRVMGVRYGCLPGDVIAGIGPSICGDHYVVGEIVQKLAKKKIPHLVKDVFFERANKLHLDLWKLNEIILRETGVKSIEVARRCTACNVAEWYSHRAESGKTGRFAVAMALKG
jgi:YfiH family protein